MSKRPAEVVIPRRPKRTSGVLYLFQQLKELDTGSSPFIVDADDADATTWSVGISSGSLREHLSLPELAKQLDLWGRVTQKQPVIVMEIRFPQDYPLSVPFLRMVRPRFKWHTGHVTIGGSMCTELLTPSGWVAMSVHALFLTVCQMFREGEAKIQTTPDEHCARPLVDYDEREAREAYQRVAAFHGWSTVAKAAPSARIKM